MRCSISFFPFYLGTTLELMPVCFRPRRLTLGNQFGQRDQVFEKDVVDAFNMR